MSSLQREILRSKLPPVPPGGNGPPPTRRGRKDYSPVKWSQYFEEIREIPVDGGDVFTVYRCQSADYKPENPVLILLHGAGYSGLTWSCFAMEIVKMAKCGVIAIDLRGHGESHSQNEEDLSAETMARDVGQIYKSLFPDQETQPPAILIGHSMGGALAVHVAARELIPVIAGLVVIDVVEGTAMDALQSMQNVLRCRPKTFNSLEYAVEWSCRSGQTRNIESAKVSMPAMLKRISDGVPATKLIGQSESQDEAPKPAASGASDTGIPEDEEAEFEKPEPPQAQRGFTWRIDLSLSEPFWEGWFKGLSATFLRCSGPKLLLLAGIDRLDKDLTIGQMQGKFQTQVLPKVGHAVHEDAPDKVAETIAAFLVRNQLCEKIGDFTPPSAGC
ncbi:protein phosphatase methylesterase 1 [Galendromus occidentalis]|uniref:Protein phosphatase methylesterase 1 n=1 Tax=Galendromus occidentalis TaxID=34638 RepID=A0AAJ6QMT8_9ACAR|nr:protein phosphatase methylesterase 1 [Galendromus occidentalis]